jgi:hypothetical protein
MSLPVSLAIANVIESQCRLREMSDRERRVRRRPGR